MFRTAETTFQTQESEVSVVEPPSDQRRARFHSLNANINADSFIRINWSQEQPPENCESLGFRVRLKSWLTSRPAWLLIVVGVLLLLLLVAILIVALVLIFVLPRQGDTTAGPVIMSTTTAAPPWLWVHGEVSGLQLYVLNLGTTPYSITPKLSGYDFGGRLYVHMNGTIRIYNPQTQKFDDDVKFNVSSSSQCSLLNLSDDCIQKGNCGMEDSVYCCGTLLKTPVSCNIHGFSFSSNSRPIEERVSTSGLQLLLTTEDTRTIKNVSEAELRVSLFNSTYTNSQGPLVPSLQTQLLTTVTLDLDNGTLPNFTFYVQDDNLLIYKHVSDLSLAEIPLPFSPLFLVSSATSSHAYVAAVDAQDIFVIRLNIGSHCISSFQSKFEFLFTGSVQMPFWAGEELYVWYSIVEGANLVKFDFGWDSDDPCPYSAN